MSDSEEEKKPYNPTRLQEPFVIYLSAPRGSGKTHQLLNMLILDEYYNDTFDKIYFICPTFNLDPKYGVLDLPASQIMLEYDEKKLLKIYSDREKQGIDGDRILLVFDDCITQTGFKKNTNDQVINKLACNGRHIGISVIIASQKTSGSSSYVRSQAEGVYIWKPRSLAEVEALYQDNSVRALSKKEFVELLEYCTREQYSHMFINYQTNEVFKGTNRINFNATEL
jgi:hypothetical protein